ncbi:hypothetical protein GIB67_036584 [Kingdonia uniflora]|uniref:Uncharacterized protein n=1 Tax=Kingdonia uniflora TaxID=39325 RepID=A0A7J7MES6_9MAGN|nr:hypothetical protein GIB67_036584 [Kingdonia uniflora]
MVSPSLLLLLLLLLPLSLLLILTLIVRPKPIKIPIKGRHVFITGGSSGIGLALARQAALQGARVSILARNVQRLEEAKNTIHLETGIDVGVFSADVRNFEAVKRAIEEAGPIDVLVCNQGVFVPRDLDSEDLEIVKFQIDVNLMGCFNLIKAALPGMKSRRDRQPVSIALMSSQAGQEKSRIKWLEKGDANTLLSQCGAINGKLASIANFTLIDGTLSNDIASIDFNAITYYFEWQQFIANHFSLNKKEDSSRQGTWIGTFSESSLLDIIKGIMPAFICWDLWKARNLGGFEGKTMDAFTIIEKVGIYGYTAYSASKFGLRGLGEALQQEVISENIHVSLIFPPDTETPGLIEGRNFAYMPLYYYLKMLSLLRGFYQISYSFKRRKFLDI